MIKIMLFDNNLYYSLQPMNPYVKDKLVII